MGNARGNRYSRQHVSLDPDGRRRDRRRFWDFSWHEVGVIDLPVMIDYVLDHTKYQQLHYIGHSQGTTSFFVMTSELPDYNDKIIAMQALAPVAFMSNLRSPIVRAAAVFLNTLDVMLFVCFSRHCTIDIFPFFNRPPRVYWECTNFSPTVIC